MSLYRVRHDSSVPFRNAYARDIDPCIADFIEELAPALTLRSREWRGDIRMHSLSVRRPAFGGCTRRPARSGFWLLKSRIVVGARLRIELGGLSISTSRRTPR
jgi:hypothetical protein